MKKLYITLTVVLFTIFIENKLVAQNSVYIVSEVWRNTAPYYDSIYVTTPTGSVTGYSIPYISNVHS